MLLQIKLLTLSLTHLGFLHRFLAHTLLHLEGQQVLPLTRALMIEQQVWKADPL
jgi:hypothetical protein